MVENDGDEWKCNYILMKINQSAFVVIILGIARKVSKWWKVNVFKNVTYVEKERPIQQNESLHIHIIVYKYVPFWIIICSSTNFNQ